MKFSRNKPPSIRQALWLSIGLTALAFLVGTGALFGWRLHVSRQQAEALRVQTVARTYAAQLSPLMIHRPAELKPFMDQLVLHSDALLLAVFDDQKRPIYSRGNDAVLRIYLENISINNNMEPNYLIPADPDKGLPINATLSEVTVQASDDAPPAGFVVCALRPASQAAFDFQLMGLYVAELLALAVVAMLLGYLCLKHNVLQPLADLAEQLRIQSDTRRLPVDRDDEIGDLARAMAAMHDNLAVWQNKVVGLEKSVTDRVASTTRQIAQQLRQTQKKAWTDALTGLGNRTMYEDKFHDIFTAQHDARQDLSLVVIDLDHFKNLNDTLGHKAGDELLRFVGELLQQCLREQDLAVRYGGDEFLLILPGVSAEEAAGVAERTIRMFAQQSRLLKVDPAPTMSAGIASLLRHGCASPETLFKFADEALYEAKRAGKSRVTIWSPDMKLIKK